ncbi:bis(5'-nucleosyl)-tetraphosphatase (symmetrical) YqeK [Alkalihalobacillus sp. LMS6]|uniref:bis(5'-nucleosyl)-tetraphosphatase (symmetrical) YqeK n=1 Tax=Bacillaceae TaxID=186817 RepID=UPI000C07E128|nr:MULTISPECIES: bis(5'-nucleosyl)-tetraphosphatase (symmetrical) YqeK [Bacillaceae]UTR07907.1 bis(5'-nucleosyl)-tetraphosphatase (symmetrical) YqeK [Alkalihalobacillus sp. LMS6]
MAITAKGAWEIVRHHLTEKRYQHTIGVTETAVRLAKQYHVDEEKAELAAIVHDICKYHDTDEMANHLAAKNETHWAAFGRELLHAPYGALYSKNELHIEDSDILQAVRSHTTGRANMSRLEQVLFVADYIEPNRSFPGVEKARELADIHLDRACLFSLNNTMKYLLSKELPIHPYTIEAYNYYTLKGEQEIESIFKISRSYD